MTYNRDIPATLEDIVQKKYIIGIIVLIGLTVYAINSLNTGYKVDDTSFQMVDAHGICHKVTNNSGEDIFVPTKTSQEWSDFRSNLPAGVTLDTCPCTGYSFKSYCYHQGDFGESCDEVCSTKGVCVTAGLVQTGSLTPETDALQNCRSVSSFFGATSVGDTSEKNEAPFSELGCTLADSTSYGYLVVHFNGTATTCDASDASIARFCSCSF